MLNATPFYAGLDAGSTTLKLVITDATAGAVATPKILFGDYRRHHADITEALRGVLADAATLLGADAPIALIVTGSAGLGLAEKLRLPFMQETIAAATMVRYLHPEVRTLVDIGGEDAKMIFFDAGRAPDIRMNGSCAGGTGAFIDQIATLLGCEAPTLDALAQQAKSLHPIASRCGVFAKTDIQNLLSRNIAPADIAASAFHAVARQLVSSLAHGRDIASPMLFCGGPLAHLSRLREACMETLNVSAADCIVPENAVLVPALGCAIAPDVERRATTLGELLARLDAPSPQAVRPIGAVRPTTSLPRLFADETAYHKWRRERERTLPRVELTDLPDGTACFLGIDSGSTTTKVIALDGTGRLLFTFYAPNGGNPLGAVQQAFTRFHDAALAAGKPNLRISRAAVTGYGEDLLKAAFDLDAGIVETLAHYRAAQRLEPDVTFLLDIGGQDMKAVFIEHGVITRLDVNEACSSGCGSFIDGFARSLSLSAPEFADIAATASAPCDLGTRCTVFMNSKVKQSQRENATRADIAAGLAYSVAKNCLHKVLKLKNTGELGTRIVVQGGTMRNHAVVRAFEHLTGLDITVAPMPELMGAYGAALHALEHATDGTDAATRTLAALAAPLPHETADNVCPGCENRCLVRRHIFANGNTFYAGNKCEKIFSNRGTAATRGENFYTRKQRLLFDRAAKKTDGTDATAPNIGIPRVLGYYESFPFWHTLLTQCGMNVTLSAPSTFKLHARGVASIMSDNICFPAKIVHGHIQDLVGKKVDRILMPFTIHERRDDADAPASAHYNCPIVSGYSDVIRSAMDTAGRHNIPLDAPVLTFNDTGLLEKACREYCLATLAVPPRTFAAAFSRALAAQQEFADTLVADANAIVARNHENQRPLIVLAGRPYHTDPLIQHKVADMLADLGADVISEDIARAAPADATGAVAPTRAAQHWANTGRILNAAAWVATAPPRVHLVQITSFGCGPDAFVIDEIGELLRHAGKSHTVLKVDDINNNGSLRLRVRSLLESLPRPKASAPAAPTCAADGTDGNGTDAPAADGTNATARFTEADRHRTILVPFFSETYSPFIPVLLGLMGYKAHSLPPADAESIDHGLRHANNEVCYPATLVIGDFLRALASGDYARDQIALGLTQTGGQCRASSYLALLKRALHNAGYADVPVVSFGTASGAVVNEQPGFHPRWRGNIRAFITGIIYADHIAQMYYATAPREALAGGAARLRDSYIAAGAAAIGRRDITALRHLLRRAAADFNGATAPDAAPVPRIGIVGEIYIKYNSVGNKNIVEWLITQGVEPVVPPLIDFFLQEIPNRTYNRRAHLAHRTWLDWLDAIGYRLTRHYQKQLAADASGFRHHHAGEDIYTKAQAAARILSPAAQYGEGWLIAAELAGFAESGVPNAVCLQPFGCIANHLVAKGIERRVRELYPRMNLLFLDLDSGTGEANLLNRLHFIVQNARDCAGDTEAANVGDFSHS